MQRPLATDPAEKAFELKQTSENSNLVLCGYVRRHGHIGVLPTSAVTEHWATTEQYFRNAVSYLHRPELCNSSIMYLESGVMERKLTLESLNSHSQPYTSAQHSPALPSKDDSQSSSTCVMLPWIKTGKNLTYVLTSREDIFVRWEKRGISSWHDILNALGLIAIS